MAFSQIVIPLLAWLVIRGLNSSGDIIAFHPAWHDPVWVVALWAVLRWSDRIAPALETVQRWSYRHYKPILIIPTLSILVFAPGILKLKVLPVFDGELPENNPKVTSYRAYEHLRAEHSFILTIYRKGGVLDLPSMDILRELSEEAERLPGVNRDSILSYRNVRAIVQTGPDEVDIRTLHESLHDIDDPVARELKLTQIVQGHPLAYGRLIDTTQRMAVVQVRYDYAVDRVGLHRQAMKLVEDFGRHYPEYIFGVVGFDILEQQIMMEIIFMAVVLSAVASLIMVILLARSFGVRRSKSWHWKRLSGVAFAMGPLTFYPVIWIMGGLGWAGVGIDTVSAVIPIVFIAVASSYGVHMVYHIGESEEESEVERVIAGSKKVLKALFTSALTTSIGFFTLAPFTVESIRKFGIFAGYGVMLMLLVICLMGPAWCRLWPIPRMNVCEKENGETWAVRAVKRLSIGSIRYPWAVACMLAVIVVFVGSQIPRLQVGSNPTEFLMPGGIFPRTSKQLTDHFGANGAVFVSYSCGEDDCVLDPTQLRNISYLAEYIRSQKGVAFVQSFNEEEQYLNERFADGAGLPESRELAAQLLLAYEMAGSKSQFISDDRRTSFLIAWGDFRQSNTVDALYTNVMKYAVMADFEVSVGSEYVLWSAQTDYIVRGKIISWIQSLCLIVLVGWALFGTIRSGLIISAPLTVATALLLGLMSALGISLDIATTVITSITIGVGADYGIHTYNAYQSIHINEGDQSSRVHQALRSALPPILYDAESNVAGFSVFLLSSLQPVVHCGYMLIISMVVASVGSLIIVPLAIRVMHRESSHAV